MFLTLEDFLAHFPKKHITKDQFVKEFTVMYSKPQTLHELFNMVSPGGKRKPIIKSTEDKRYIKRQEIVDYFYEIIVENREKYLTCFFNAYFDFKKPNTLVWDKPDLMKKKAPTKKVINENKKASITLDAPIISVQQNDASRRMIRNLFYLELLDLTKVTNTVKSQVSFWQSLVNMYNHLRLEDRFFAPSSIDLFLRDKKTKKAAEQHRLTGKKEINYNNLFYLFQAYQPKASIFNPYAIKWIFENIINPEVHSSSTPSKVFSPVLSWGSYLAAFMHVPGYKHYVGVDVMNSVCAKVDYLGEWYQKLGAEFNKNVEILCTPSEDLLNDPFSSEFSEYFDVIIVCPPYYDMEIYHEGKQSIETYSNYEDWLAGYWGRTVEMCKKVSAPGGVFALIANDYQTLDNKSYPLTDDLTGVVRKHFDPVGKFYLQNRTSPLRAAAKARTERLYLFRS